ncbi:Sugar-binding region [Pseudomonas syringae pv. persicae]|nr:Sugar-binding region [Pseudomonas syringae pv. persicae]
MSNRATCLPTPYMWASSSCWRRSDAARRCRKHSVANGGFDSSFDSRVFHQALSLGCTESAICVSIRQHDTAPASSTPTERSPRRLARPIFAIRSLVESRPCAAAFFIASRASFNEAPLACACSKASTAGINMSIGHLSPTPASVMSCNQARLSGTVGDMMGYDFIDIHGQPAVNAIQGRVIGLTVQELFRIPDVVAIASENTKAATLGALRSGVINTLATTVTNAHTILALDDATRKG